MRHEEKPLPVWRQKARAVKARWRRSADRRKAAGRAFGTMVRRGVTLAISLAGATLVSIGVYQVYSPAGLVTAGVLLWAVQWNYGDEEGNG